MQAGTAGPSLGRGRGPGWYSCARVKASGEQGRSRVVAVSRPRMAWRLPGKHVRPLVCPGCWGCWGSVGLGQGTGQPEFSSAGDPGPGAPPAGLERPQECLGEPDWGDSSQQEMGGLRESGGRGGPASGSGSSSGGAAPSLVPPTPGPPRDHRGWLSCPGGPGLGLLRHPRAPSPAGPWAHVLSTRLLNQELLGGGFFTKDQSQEWPTGSVHECVCARVCTGACVQPREEPCQQLSSPGGLSVPRLLGASSPGVGPRWRPPWLLADGWAHRSSRGRGSAPSGSSRACPAPTETDVWPQGAPSPSVAMRRLLPRPLRWRGSGPRCRKDVCWPGSTAAARGRLSQQW